MLAYLNGEYVPIQQARISPLDRGFLFADGVYEVVRTGPSTTPGQPARFVGLNRHIRRLERSLRHVRIDWDARGLAQIAAELVARGGPALADALVYLQITRGAPDLAASPAPLPRTHLPAKGLRPTVFAFARPIAPLDLADPRPLVKRCAVLSDARWSRCDIKSVSLLGNILAAMDAADAGAEDAVLLRPPGALGGERMLSETSLANVLIATPGGELVTPPLEGGTVLPGITRELLLDLEPSIAQRPIPESELRVASEVMLLGTTSAVTAVTHLDGRAVGLGAPGPHARRLAGLLGAAIRDGRDDVPLSAGERGGTIA